MLTREETFELKLRHNGEKEKSPVVNFQDLDKSGATYSVHAVGFDFPFYHVNVSVGVLPKGLYGSWTQLKDAEKSVIEYLRTYKPKADYRAKRRHDLKEQAALEKAQSAEVQ
jgi:hypothetical protein